MSSTLRETSPAQHLAVQTSSVPTLHDCRPRRLLVVLALDPAGNESLLLQAAAWSRLFHGEAFALDVMSPQRIRSPVLYSLDGRPRHSAGLHGQPLSLLPTGHIAATRRDDASHPNSPATQRDVHDVVTAVVAEIGADLILLPRWSSARSRPTFDTGDFATRLVRSLQVPCLVMDHPFPGGAIVAATDLTDPTFPVVRYAAQLAREAGGDVTLMHNLDTVPIGPLLMGFVGPTVLLALNHPDRSLRQASQRLEAAASQSQLHATRRITRESDTTATILAMAAEQRANLIITGTHPRARFRLFPRFSVADAVVAHASCSVLIVPLYIRLPQATVA